MVADYWRGSASLGSRIMTSSTNWRNDSRGFDQFEWVRDLRAFGGSQARSRARQLIEGWIDRNNNWRVAELATRYHGAARCQFGFLL